MQRKQENRTPFVKKEEVNRKWFVFNAEGKVLGRLSSEIAKVLRGKHKPSFTPHIDMGDGVIVINAEKVRVTGNKEGQKVYRSYTGHPGGQREVIYRELQAKHPEEIIRHAVKGMMPKSRLGNQQLKKLRVFKGAEHTLEAQQAIEVKA